MSCPQKYFPLYVLYPTFKLLTLTEKENSALCKYLIVLQFHSLDRRRQKIRI